MINFQRSMRATRWRAGQLALGSIGAAIVLMFAACNTKDILSVSDPDVPNPSSLNGISGLPVLLAGAVGDFEVAYQGPGDGSEVGQIGASGLLGDEIRSVDTYPDRTQIDQRNTTPANRTNTRVFFTIERARASADRAEAQYVAFAPDSAGRALALALSGFATIIMGENYCSGVPISSVNAAGTTITYGKPLTTTALWALALAKFDTAGAVPDISPDVQNLIAVGIGRALVDSGQYDAAAAAVANVPAGFVYNIESSANSPREGNGVWWFIDNFPRISVADSDGGTGLGYTAANDPRVQWADSGIIGVDHLTPSIQERKYPDRASPTPLATAAEARLIEAEDALHHSDDVTFLAKLNAARAEFPGMQPLPVDSIPATFDGKVDLLFRERAFSLWLTSHRLGDMRRLIRQYGRNSETVFPTGTWYRGTAAKPTGTVPYGADVNLPIPETELNNPNSQGCLDRNP